MKNQNSPFKMKPGRGNNPKTGNGIPTQLMSGSPLKQKLPYTKGDMGLQRNAQSGDFEPRGYEKRIVESGTDYHLVGGDNKTIKSVKKSDKKGYQKMLREHLGDSTETMNRRAANANAINAFTKTTTNVPAERVVQENLKKVRYNRQTGEADVSRGHQQNSERLQNRDRNLNRR
jgi:hypothetical protein